MSGKGEGGRGKGLFFLASHSGESVAGKTESRPFVHWLGADLLVERDRQLVPVENCPVEAATLAIDGNPCELTQQSESYSVLPKGRLHEEILEVKTSLAQPG